MKKSTVYCLTSLLALGSASALAQDTQQEPRTTAGNDRTIHADGHFYVGGNYGMAKPRGEEFDDENDFIEVNAGGFFNPYVGLEASATLFDDYSSDLGSLEIEGYGIALIGRLPVYDDWGIYAKVGQFFWDSEIDTAVGSYSNDGNDTFFGIGTDLPITENLKVIVEYNRYAIDSRLDEVPGIDNTDLDTVKAGIRLAF